MMSNNYFDFLSSSAPAEEKQKTDNTSNIVNVTVRVDSDAFLLCDGEYLETQLTEGKLEKVQLPAGQHLLQFMSVEYPEIMTEKEVDFPDAGKGYLVIIKELRALVDAENEKQRLVSEEATKQAAMKATLERKKYLESIDFVEKYLNQDNLRILGHMKIKDEFDAFAINNAIENEIKPAVELGIHSAEFVYSLILRFGSGGVVDGDNSMRLLINAAKGGFAEAQYAYGNDLCNGEGGVFMNEKEAVEWYQRAAVQGFPAAQDMLGKCYLYGWGVEINKEKAVEWFQRAANQGYPPAETNLYYCSHQS